MSLAVLKAARDKISDPERWTKCAMARDAQGGIALPATDERATCWCIIGAVYSVAPSLPVAQETVNALRLNSPRGLNIAAWNDDIGTKHEDIMALFDVTVKAWEGTV